MKKLLYIIIIISLLSLFVYRSYAIENTYTINQIVILDGGHDYTTPVVLEDGIYNNNGAILVTHVVAGEIIGIDVLNGGVFTSTPVITISDAEPSSGGFSGIAIMTQISGIPEQVTLSINMMLVVCIIAVMLLLILISIQSKVPLQDKIIGISIGLILIAFMFVIAFSSWL